METREGGAFSSSNPGMWSDVGVDFADRVSDRIFCPPVPVGLCPEGLGDGSQAVHCLGPLEKEPRPIRDGVIKSDQTLLSMLPGEPSGIARSRRPYGTGPFFRLSRQ